MLKNLKPRVVGNVLGVRRVKYGRHEVGWTLSDPRDRSSTHSPPIGRAKTRPWWRVKAGHPWPRRPSGPCRRACRTLHCRRPSCADDWRRRQRTLCTAVLARTQSATRALAAGARCRTRDSTKTWTTWTTTTTSGRPVVAAAVAVWGQWRRRQPEWPRPWWTRCCCWCCYCCWRPRRWTATVSSLRNRKCR